MIHANGGINGGIMLFMDDCDNYGFGNGGIFHLLFIVVALCNLGNESKKGWSLD